MVASFDDALKSIARNTGAVVRHQTGDDRVVSVFHNRSRNDFRNGRAAGNDAQLVLIFLCGNCNQIGIAQNEAVL
jgi:hypothetical protein